MHNRQYMQRLPKRAQTGSAKFGRGIDAGNTSSGTHPPLLHVPLKEVEACFLFFFSNVPQLESPNNARLESYSCDKIVVCAAVYCLLVSR